jgi:hypothetical protein
MTQISNFFTRRHKKGYVLIAIKFLNGRHTKVRLNKTTSVIFGEHCLPRDADCRKILQILPMRKNKITLFVANYSGFPWI